MQPAKCMARRNKYQRNWFQKAGWRGKNFWGGARLQKKKEEQKRKPERKGGKKDTNQGISAMGRSPQIVTHKGRCSKRGRGSIAITTNKKREEPYKGVGRQSIRSTPGGKEVKNAVDIYSKGSTRTEKGRHSRRKTPKRGTQRIHRQDKKVRKKEG